MALIAVIDDDPDIVETTTMVLKSKGYDVVSASNPDDGYDVIKNESPDLIILDVIMVEPDDVSSWRNACVATESRRRF